MVIQEIKNKETWNNFVISQEKHTFLHAWEWGEFNREMGDSIWHLGIYDDDQLMAVALVLGVRARRGNFLFIPHGPIIKSQGISQSETRHKIQTILQVLTQELQTIAKEEGIIFIRISPLLAELEVNRLTFKNLGFRPAPTQIHAEVTWTLDLAPDEEQLLMGMRKTTRNLVRRAEREGVSVTISDSEEDVLRFYKLYNDTSKKQHFTPFSLRYIKEEVYSFSRDGHARVVLGWYKGEPHSGAIVIVYGTSAYYHHGASSSVYPKIPTAYAVQWAAIKEAKRLGVAHYNFWGIAPEEQNKSHPWAGLTLFKKGFGGYRTDYLHAQDLPLSWKYWITWGIETLRRKKRNL